MKTLLLFLLLIAGEAVYEGLATRGRKTLAGIIELIIRGITLLIILLWISGAPLFFFNRTDLLPALAGYLLLRAGIFRPLWNLAAGQPYTYIGHTKLYDKIIYWIVYRSPLKPYPGIFLSTVEFLLTLLGVWFVVK